MKKYVKANSDRTYFVFYRDEYNYKDYIFEGSYEECEQYCEDAGWELDGYELEIQ